MTFALLALLAVLAVACAGFCRHLAAQAESIADKKQSLNFRLWDNVAQLVSLHPDTDSRAKVQDEALRLLNERDAAHKLLNTVASGVREVLVRHNEDPEFAVSILRSLRDKLETHDAGAKRIRETLRCAKCNGLVFEEDRRAFLLPPYAATGPVFCSLDCAATCDKLTLGRLTPFFCLLGTQTSRFPSCP